MSVARPYDQLKQKAAEGDAAALTALKEMAERDGGDADGLFLLGRLFDESSGTKLSAKSPTARKYYLRAAKLGHRLAQLCVGNMFDYGEGGQRDYVEARRWYQAAANQGVRDAQMHFGRMLEVGRGGPADKEEAAKWYMRATEQGDELAATNLASMHLHGELAESNFELAIRLLTFSAERLDGIAHLHLGDVYMNRTDIERSSGRALMHYYIAGLLLPPGPRRDLVISRREAAKSQNAVEGLDVEKLALAYIAERQGRLPN
jgi:TPR repeat protein